MAVEHEELEDAIAALVLGSASPEDRPRLLAHLEACSGCRELAARLGRVTAILPMEPDPVEPPARLHGRVMAAVAAADQDDAPPVRQRRMILLPRPRRFRLPLPSRRLGVAAAAVLVFFALGAGAGHSVPFGSGPVATQQVVRHPLRGTGSMVGVRASAVTLMSDGLTLVDFRDMPRPQAGQVYELWLITADGRALPAAVFEPDADGSKVVLVTQDLKGTRELAVTVEHGPDGSPVPTQAPQLSGQV
jgi:anti-sigma factor RsiW